MTGAVKSINLRSCLLHTLILPTKNATCMSEAAGPIAIKFGMFLKAGETKGLHTSGVCILRDTNISQIILQLLLMRMFVRCQKASY